MPITDYSEDELRPRELTPEERENPYQVINEFFQVGHLPQIRQEMWVFFKAAVTGGYTHSFSRRERVDLVYFYECLERLVEAVYLIHLKKASS